MLICRYVLQKKDFNTVKWCRCRITLRKCRTPTLIIKSSPMRRSEVLGVGFVLFYTQGNDKNEIKFVKGHQKKQQQNQKRQQKKRQKPSDIENRKTQSKAADSHNDQNDQQKTRRSVLLGESPYEGRTALLAAEPTRFRYTPFLAYLLLPSHGTTARVEIYLKNWTKWRNFTCYSVIHINSSNILHFIIISDGLAFEYILLTITFSEQRKKNMLFVILSLRFSMGHRFGFPSLQA